jgi:hypothetical protein
MTLCFGCEPLQVREFRPLWVVSASPPDCGIVTAVGVEVIVEAGPKRRVFARVADWPGWCRSGRDEAAAASALEAARPRYQAMVVTAGLRLPAATLEVTERVAGTAVTDFGALGVAAPSDRQPLLEEEQRRFLTLLSASWSTFTDAFASVAVAEREVRPVRGRSPAQILLHVLETDAMHVSGITSGPFRKPIPGGGVEQLLVVQERLLHALASVPTGTTTLPSVRHGFTWTPRFAVHRSAWHALDHAWELVDRSVR